MPEEGEPKQDKISYGYLCLREENLNRIANNQLWLSMPEAN